MSISPLRLVKKLSLYLLLPLIVLIALVMFTVATPTGIRFIFSTVSALVPNVEIKGVSGDWSNLKIDEVNVSPEGVQVNVKNIEVGIDIDCLLNRELCVTHLNVASTLVNVDTSEDSEDLSPPRTEPLRIATPIPITLQQARLSNTQVDVNDLSISLKQLDLSANWSDDVVTIPNAVGDTFKLLSPLHEDTTTINTTDSSLQDKAIAQDKSSVQNINRESKQQLEQLLALPSTLNTLFDHPILASLPTVILPMDYRLDNFSLNQADLLIGSLGITLKDTQLSAHSQQALVNVDKLSSKLGLCFGDLCGEFNTSIKSTSVDMQKDWPVVVEGVIDTLGPIYQLEQYGLDLSGHKLELAANGGLLSDLQQTIKIEGPVVNTVFSATVNLKQPYLPFIFNLEPTRFSWPNKDLTFTKQSDANVIDTKLTDIADTKDLNNQQIQTDSTTTQQTIIPANAYQFDIANLAISGNLENYNIQLLADFELPQLPAGKLSLDTQLGLSGADIAKLAYQATKPDAQEQANTAKSPEIANQHLGSVEQIELAGKLGWVEGITWNASTTFSQLALEKLLPDLTVGASGGFTSTGEITTDKWLIALKNTQIEGKINQFPLEIAGEISGSSTGLWEIPRFSLQVGKNRVQLSGALKDDWKLNVSIDAPNLAGILPSLKGQINGELNLTGNLLSPTLDAKLEAKKFGWEQFIVDNLAFNANLTSDEQMSGKLDLTASGFKQNGIVIDRLSLNLAGDENAHQLSLNAKGDPLSLNLALTGQFDRTNMAWKSTLKQAVVNTPVGEVKLDQTIAIDIEPERLEIGPHCWTHNFAELCVTKPVLLGEQGQIELALKKFDLEMLRDYLPSGTKLTGLFTGESTLNWNVDTQPTGLLSLTAKNLAVIQHIDDADIAIRFDDAKLTAEVEDNQLKAETLISLANNGNFQSSIRINDLSQRRTLSGNLNLQNINLNLLQPLFAANEKITGAINSQLTLSGQLDSPLVNGQFNLSDLQVISFRIPFDISDSNLNIAFNGQRSTLQGNITTPDGVMNLSGSADWRVLNNWQASLNAQSDRLRINLPPLAQIDLSPNLNFDANKDRLILKGSVDIPWGRITVDQLPESVVEVSRDEVMLDNNLQPIKQPAAAIPVSTDLQVRVGKDVQINAFGLESFLRGDLQVTQNELGLALNGEINTYQGRFRAYGQDLVLQKGVIAFAGSPDRPRLNIEAIRNPENMSNDVTAGIRVTGFSDDPRIELFSVPAMAQEEILSYILRGQGLDAAGADSSLMTSMLIGVGTAQSGRLIGIIGETFGVQNLTLDTQGSGDKSQVVVSGDIFDGLQVRYGVGIFDSLATLTLRYQLMPRLYLEAVSGLDQAIDILYQFEFN